MNSTSLLQVEHISKCLGNVQAVSDISFTVNAGEIVALVGPNGAGKSTTLGICEGLITPDSGTVTFLGEKVTKSNSDRIHVNMGIMLQHNGGYPSAKTREIIQLYAQLYTEPFNVDWLLDIVGLSEVTRVSYRRLSGGQQQRLSLACAIVGKPQLIILDEPSAGLDFAGQALIIDLLKSMTRDGVGIILTSHSLTEIENLSDRIIVLSQGKIVEHGDYRLLSSQGNDCLSFSTTGSFSLQKLAEFLPDDYVITEISGGKYFIKGIITPHILHNLTHFGQEYDILFSEIRVGTKGINPIMNMR